MNKQARKRLQRSGKRHRKHGKICKQSQERDSSENIFHHPIPPLRGSMGSRQSLCPAAVLNTIQVFDAENSVTLCMTLFFHSRNGFRNFTVPAVGSLEDS